MQSRRSLRNLEPRSGSSAELEELQQLLLLLLLDATRRFTIFFASFLHRSFLKPHFLVLFFLPAFGMAVYTFN